jgi:butyryl-CoA dehydrogenase
MRDFFLTDEDRAFAHRDPRLPQPRTRPSRRKIERDEDWEAVKQVVRALGAAGYMKLMFRDLYDGWLSQPGLTHATMLSEEAAYLNYAFETTIATALSCAYPLHAHARRRSASVT